MKTSSIAFVCVPDGGCHTLSGTLSPTSALTSSVSGTGLVKNSMPSVNLEGCCNRQSGAKKYLAMFCAKSDKKASSGRAWLLVYSMRSVVISSLIGRCRIPRPITEPSGAVIVVYNVVVARHVRPRDNVTLGSMRLYPWSLYVTPLVVRRLRL